MPIESPLRPPNVTSKTRAEFVVCAEFVFRIADVDGFSHQTLPDESAVTVVNFKSYTQTIRDTDRRLFGFLLAAKKPASVDETE